jgi:phosphonate transport system permease protein
MSALRRFLSFFPQFFPPYFSAHYFSELLTPLGQTIEMAAGGMIVALIVGLLTGTWVGAGLPGGRIIYVLLACLRSIPDLTLAIFSVVVVGIGPAAGMLALAAFYSAAVGKIFADLFLSADPDPIEALRATGASRLSVALFGNLPLRLKDILSYGAYEFESAVRASVIVGAVGGGGLGTEIVGTINAFDYHRTTTLILVLILLIAVIDKFAQFVKQKAVVVWFVLPLAALAFWHNFPATVAISHAISTFGTMLPPQLPGDAIRHIPQLLLETLEIAVGGTLLGMIAGLPLGLCAASNLAPPVLYVPVRRFLEALRAVPEIIWGLVLVTAIGIGPQAGVFALACHATGALGRLFAESFENTPPEPVRAVAATGAGPLSLAAFAFVPLALAPLAVHTLFRLEWNVRAATIVGVIGAGGIGGALFNAQQLFFYKQMMAYIGITWLLVLTVDSSSGFLRRRMKLMEVYE